jgi:O-antigen/teichoic acid export membrane protein
LASLKKLAGQTVWYGLSNIGARFLNYILTPIVTYLLHTKAQQADYGDYSVLMSAIAFVNVVYTYGMETAYFRFSAQGTDRNTLFQTTFSSLLVSTLLLSAGIIFYRHEFDALLGLNGHSEYIIWCVLIIAIDTMAAIPFARLRQEERPRKYAFTKVAGIFVNILLTLFFIYYSPQYVAAHPDSWYAHWYAQYNNAGFLILANLVQALVTFLLLWQEWKGFKFRIDGVLWRKVMIYSAPMVIVGLGGMVNETMDRLMLRNLLPTTDEAAKIAVGIYSANYKLAIFITLFIQAFKMSAEPFFFSQAADKNAPKTYARVMKWFVITLCLAFLFTALYIDIWKYFVGASYREGLGVVPILLAANLALGIYYNLSVWYKITDRMYIGMLITLVGVALTLLINFTLIPRFGMYACAWATFAAYASMMVISYLAGQKYFPVPYNVRKLLAYMGVMFFLFFAQKGVMWITDIVAIRLITASICMFLFLRLVFVAEKKELARMPVIGRWVKVPPTA